MRTRSSLEYTIPRRRNRRRSRQQQEAIPIVDTEPEFPMADDRPMAEQLQAPTGGFESAIVVPPINAQNFELKSSLINLVQNRIFRGGNDEEPHAHIRHFESITNNQRNVIANQGYHQNQGYNRTGNNGNQVNHGANLGLTQQAQAYQAPSTQVPVTYARFEAYTKSNDVTLNNLQKNLNEFKREQQDFQNEQRNFQNMMLNMFQKQIGDNNASGSGTLIIQDLDSTR
ncbi:hypothetical protein Tco_0675705, partial [Tanacetum coccineum]